MHSYLLRTALRSQARVGGEGTQHRLGAEIHRKSDPRNPGVV